MLLLVLFAGFFCMLIILGVIIMFIVRFIQLINLVSLCGIKLLILFEEVFVAIFIVFV